MGNALDRTGNRLLGALPQTDCLRLQENIQPVRFLSGRALYETGDVDRYIYLPTSAIVSLVCIMECGASAEIAIVDYEGAVGASLIMGDESTTSRAVVHSAGRGFRIAAKSSTEEFDRGGILMHILLKYTQALMTQVAQCAAGNRHHSIEQQLCRWLLLGLDRIGLERRTCECYGVVKHEYDRMLPARFAS